MRKCLGKTDKIRVTCINQCLGIDVSKHRPPADIRLHNSCCAAEDIGISGL